MSGRSRSFTLGSWLQRRLPWVLGVVVILSGNWTASVLDALFRGTENNGVLSLAEVAAFVIAVLWLYRIRNTLGGARTRSGRSEPAQHRPHLVLFLSALDRNAVTDEGVPKGFQWSGEPDDVLRHLESHKRQPGNRPWPWEQTLRAMRHHSTKGVLRSVTLVCSRESLPESGKLKRLAAGFTEFQNLQWRFLLPRGKGGEIRDFNGEPPAVAGWDFEDFDGLTQGFRDLFRDFRKRLGARDWEIMVDFTSGPKVVSVVAATATFDLDVKAEYVQTNPPYGVISYDVVVDRSETDLG